MAIQPGSGYTFTASSLGEFLNIEKPWSEWDNGGFQCSPYKVHDVVLKTGEGGDYVVFQICSATFNNLIPQSYDSVNEEWVYINDLYEDTEFVLDFASTTSSIVYMRVGVDGSNFPATSPAGGTNDPYPRIYSTGGTLPSDDDDFGYVAIAQVNQVSAGVYTVEQYVTGSLWGDRVKLGTLTAKYYYARI